MNKLKKRLFLEFRSMVALSALVLFCGVACLLFLESVPLLAVTSMLICAAWVVPVLYAVRFRERASLVTIASKNDLKTVKREVVEKIDETRVKESRHEYHQELSLDRIEAELRRLHVANNASGFPSEEPLADVLFVTSNGAGLGHISRLLAIAEQLPSGRKFEMLTLSKAYRQAAGAGLTVHYFPSSEAAGVIPERWNRAFREYFRTLILRIKPRVVVFDGTWVYLGLTDVCRALDMPLVWVQRGMWKSEVDKASVQRHAADTVADVVIVPGDYAGSEVVDTGKKIEPRYVGPIVRTSRSQLLAREQACRLLGLDPSGQFVLLNLAGGILGSANSIAEEVANELANIAPALQIVQVISPLADPPGEHPNVKQVSAYPVMPYARVFEFAVSAAGYNAAQEAVSLGLLTILIPNDRTKTDDQVRRAEKLAAKGFVLHASDHAGLLEALQTMVNAESRRSLRQTIDALEEAGGASESARIIDEVIEQASWPSRADSVYGKSEPARHVPDKSS